MSFCAVLKKYKAGHFQSPQEVKKLMGFFDDVV